jgi:hypothetical protein
VLRIAIGSRRTWPGQDVVLGMVLDLDQLGDDDWTLFSEHAYRTGTGKRNSDEIQRARQIGSITARRCFRRTSSMTSLLISVSPYGSADDARARLHAPPLAKPFTRIAHTDERPAEGVTIPEADEAVAFESDFVGNDGAGTSKRISAAVGSCWFGMLMSTVGHQLKWDEVSSLATAQADRIRHAIDQPPA